MTNSSNYLLPLTNIRSYGAIGNGISDDTAAINAAIAAGGAIFVPAGIYNISSELVASDLIMQGIYGKSIIRATTSQRSVLAVSGLCSLSGITLDGYRQSNYCLLRLGDNPSSIGGSNYTECHFLNALIDGCRAAMGTSGAVSSVTQVGSGPSITVSLIDTTFFEYLSPFIVKITTGGALGTAIFQISIGGGGYVGTQTLYSSTQVGYASSPFTTSTGILLTATAGTYVLNTTYSFTGTITNVVNNYGRFAKCLAQNCGAVYATSGLIGNYPSPTYNAISASGTVATTGTAIINGTGTSFMSMGARDGDQMLISGKRYSIACVLNDFQIALDQNFFPTGVTSGLGYAISVGSGWWEDVETGNQLATLYDHCSAISCAQGIRVAGLGGATLLNPIIHYPAITGIVVSTAFAD